MSKPKRKYRCQSIKPDVDNMDRPTREQRTGADAQARASDRISNPGQGRGHRGAGPSTSDPSSRSD